MLLDPAATNLAGKSNHCLLLMNGGWEVSPSSDHQYFPGRESELPAFTKQGMGELCPQLFTQVVDTIQAENWSTDWFFQAEDGRLALCSDTGLGNQGTLLASVGQEDGVEAKFPDHSTGTAWFYPLCWLDLDKNFQEVLLLLGSSFPTSFLGKQAFLEVWFVCLFCFDLCLVLCHRRMGCNKETMRLTAMLILQILRLLGWLSSFCLSESFYVCSVCCIYGLLVLRKNTWEKWNCSIFAGNRSVHPL